MRFWAEQPQANVREPCRRFEVSPKTAYKWINRYRDGGQDKCRVP
ncbi:helix-turn-helix domain-containing protein [Pseudomonas sp.]